MWQRRSCASALLTPDARTQPCASMITACTARSPALDPSVWSLPQLISVAPLLRVSLNAIGAASASLKRLITAISCCWEPLSSPLVHRASLVLVRCEQVPTPAEERAYGRPRAQRPACATESALDGAAAYAWACGVDSNNSRFAISVASPHGRVTCVCVLQQRSNHRHSVAEHRHLVDVCRAEHRHTDASDISVSVELSAPEDYGGGLYLGQAPRSPCTGVGGDVLKRSPGGSAVTRRTNSHVAFGFMHRSCTYRAVCGPDTHANIVWLSLRTTCADRGCHKTNTASGRRRAVWRMCRGAPCTCIPAIPRTASTCGTVRLSAHSRFRVLPPRNVPRAGHALSPEAPPSLP